MALPSDNRDRSECGGGGVGAVTAAGGADWIAYSIEWFVTELLSVACFDPDAPADALTS